MLNPPHRDAARIRSCKNVKINHSNKKPLCACLFLFHHLALNKKHAQQVLRIAGEVLHQHPVRKHHFEQRVGAWGRWKDWENILRQVSAPSTIISKWDQDKSAASCVSGKNPCFLSLLPNAFLPKIRLILTISLITSAVKMFV